MESLHLHVTGPLRFRFLIPHHHHNHELLIDQLRRQLTTERTVLSEAAAFCPVSRTTILRPFVRYRRRVRPDIGQNRTNVRTYPHVGVRTDRMGCHPFCPVASRFSSSLEQVGRFGSRRLVSQSVECSLREVVSLSYGAPRVAPCVRSAAHRVARRVRSGAPCGAPCQGCQWWVVVSLVSGPQRVTPSGPRQAPRGRVRPPTP